MTADTPEPQPRRKWHLQRWLLALVAAMMAYGAWTEYAFRSALKQARATELVVDYTDPVEMIRADWKNAFKKDTWMDGVRYVEPSTGEALEQHRALIHRLNPKFLGIGNAQSLQDLSSIKGLTRLTELGIYNGGSLTNIDALKNLTTLKEIKLYKCAALTNVDGLKNLPALQGVALVDCTGLTNVDGLKNLPSLRAVKLSGCTGLTNMDALKGLTALERVYLSRCTGLKNVDGLMNLTALKELDLYGCTGLTEEQINALKAALPKTDIDSDY